MRVCCLDQETKVVGKGSSGTWRANLEEVPLWTQTRFRLTVWGNLRTRTTYWGVQKAQERDGDAPLLHICLFLLSLLTLPGSVTLNFSQLSISLPCFQSAEAWVYLDPTVSLALVSVLWWVLKLGVAGDGGIVKTGMVFSTL